MAFTITASTLDGKVSVTRETAAEAVSTVEGLQERGAVEVEIRDSNGDALELTQLMALAAQDKHR